MSGSSKCTPTIYFYIGCQVLEKQGTGHLFERHVSASQRPTTHPLVLALFEDQDRLWLILNGAPFIIGVRPRTELLIFRRDTGMRINHANVPESIPLRQHGRS